MIAFCRYLKEKASGKEFVFEPELVAYCRMDVEILTKASMKFRSDYMEMHGIDPFAVAITIPSACMYVSFS